MSIAGQRGKRGTKHPYLTGNFAPTTKIFAPTPISYSGTIPEELIGGQYVRNGANPISNSDLGRDAHWFDGDGMLSGVYIKRSPVRPHGVSPRFVNRQILTDVALSAFENESLQTPILPSISTLVSPASSLVLIIWRILRSAFLVLLSHILGSQQAIKRISVANTGVFYHDGRALATCESGPPIRIQLPKLETVGWYDGIAAEGEHFSMKTHGAQEGCKDVLGGAGICSWMREWTTGHPKVDPATDEMILFHCNFLPPYVHYSVIPPTLPESARPNSPGKSLMNLPVPGCTGGKMMHDFGVSKSHTVILDLPLSLTPLNLVKNLPVVFYDPNKPARFGVFPRRDPSAVRWFETSGCCIFHTANTWDEFDVKGNTIAVNLLACRLTSASLVFSAGNMQPPPHPDQNQPADRKRMSFLAKYNKDDALENLEKVKTAPFLSAEDASVILEEPFPGNGSSAHPISEDDEEQCRLYYYRFALTPKTRETITHQYALSSIPFEFPTLSPLYEMSRARYIYGCSTSSKSFGAALGKATKIDILVKMDVETLLASGEANPPKSITGCIDSRPIAEILASKDARDPIRAFQMPTHHYTQEARFVPRLNARTEDDGYLLFYVFDESQLDNDGECREDAKSELWVLDAKDMATIICKFYLPTRVPYGLHGNWFSERQIKDQREVASFRSLPEQRKQTWLSRRKAALVSALG